MSKKDSCWPKAVANLLETVNSCDKLKLDIALSIGGIEIVTKMILYYLHERAWFKLLKR